MCMLWLYFSVELTCSAYGYCNHCASRLPCSFESAQTQACAWTQNKTRHLTTAPTSSIQIPKLMSHRQMHREFYTHSFFKGHYGVLYEGRSLHEPTYMSKKRRDRQNSAISWWNSVQSSLSCSWSWAGWNFNAQAYLSNAFLDVAIELHTNLKSMHPAHHQLAHVWSRLGRIPSRVAFYQFIIRTICPCLQLYAHVSTMILIWILYLIRSFYVFFTN